MDSPSVRLEIPARTILKVVFALALISCFLKLVPLLLMVAIAVLIAVTLSPVESWLMRKGLPRWAALILIVVLMIGFFVFLLFVLIPEVAGQAAGLIQNLSPIQKDVQEAVPAGVLRRFVQKTIRNPEAVFGSLPGYLTAMGSIALGGLYQVALLMILSIYLLVDGRRAYEWFVAFFAVENRVKIRLTCEELMPVIFAYVAGQAITSALVFGYTLAVHTWLGIPGALTLSLLAAVFDILPIIGFLSSTVCTAILALTVSTETAGLAVLAYFFYHLLENYLIVPKVYGDRMRLSTLAVLLSFLIASTLAGIAGAILALPVVASYAVIERIWLRRQLGEETVRKHQSEPA